MTAKQGPPTVRIYTKKWCGFCFAAKRLFTRLGIEFEEIRVDRDHDVRRRAAIRAGNWPTVPMIFIGDDFVGGYAEAAALHRTGELEARCNRPGSDPPAS